MPRADSLFSVCNNITICIYPGYTDSCTFAKSIGTATPENLPHRVDCQAFRIRSEGMDEMILRDFVSSAIWTVNQWSQHARSVASSSAITWEDRPSPGYRASAPSSRAGNAIRRTKEVDCHRLFQVGVSAFVRFRKSVRNHRGVIPLLVVLAAASLTKGCGDGKSPSAPFTPPDPPRPTTLTVSPTTAELTAVGANVQLTARVVDQNGNVMPGANVSWSSGDTAVATVGAAGLVTAVGNGTVLITATMGSASGSAAVTVAQSVRGVSVSPAGDTVVVGDTLRLKAEATDANGHPVAGTEFTWVSGDTTVAAVDPSGLVTALAAGEVEITATTSGVAGRAELTIAGAEPTNVEVVPDSVALTALGQSAQLSAEVRDQIGRKMDAVAVSWSSADTTVAAVDSAGLVLALGGGATMITARAGEVADTAFVTVTQSADSVVVSPAVDAVIIGDTLRLVAQAFDENGHAIAGAELTWSSNNDFVAAVDSSGLVTGVAEGHATVSATARGAASGSSEITVEHVDRAALVAFYEATNGPAWTNSHGWLGSEPLGQWYGIEVDEEGGVIGLALSENNVVGPIPLKVGDFSGLQYLHLDNNGLSGALPPELAQAGGLVSLRINGNALSGPLPLSLAGLSLRELHYRDTELCVPDDSSFREWLRSVPSHEGTGVECAPPTDREILRALYDATDGPNWKDNRGWLTEVPLGEWYGVRTDADGGVVRLNLSRNGLWGTLPSER